jgi:DNA-binding transcriptional ArsR family regulator
MPDDSEAATMRKAITGHETRRRIMKALDQSDSPASPREVAEWLGATLSNVSYHVRVLANCNALTLVHTKAVRGSMQHFYRPSDKSTELGLPTIVEAPSEATA